MPGRELLAWKGRCHARGCDRSSLGARRGGGTDRCKRAVIVVLLVFCLVVPGLLPGLLLVSFVHSADGLPHRRGTRSGHCLFGARPGRGSSPTARRCHSPSNRARAGGPMGLPRLGCIGEAPRHASARSAAVLVVVLCRHALRQALGPTHARCRLGRSGKDPPASNHAPPPAAVIDIIGRGGRRRSRGGGRRGGRRRSKAAPRAAAVPIVLPLVRVHDDDLLVLVHADGPLGGLVDHHHSTFVVVVDTNHLGVSSSPPSPPPPAMSRVIRRGVELDRLCRPRRPAGCAQRRRFVHRAPRRPPRSPHLSPGRS